MKKQLLEMDSLLICLYSCLSQTVTSTTTKISTLCQFIRLFSKWRIEILFM